MFCPHCGYRNEERAKFCINCGAELGEQPGEDGAQSPSQPFYRSDEELYEFLRPYSEEDVKPKKKTGLIVGLIITAVVLIGIAFAIVFIVDRGNAVTEPDLTKHPARTELATDADGRYLPNDYSSIDWDTIEYGDEAMLNDFSYTDGWLSMSPSAERITDFSGVVGLWKAVMITDPEGETDEGKSVDYFSVEISGTPEDTFVAFNWDRRVIERTGEVSELRGGRGGHSGSFSNGSIKAENGNIVELTGFWSDGGTVYAVGRFTWTDGTMGYIGLIKQQ